jgi:hypothetical protein
MKDISKRLFSLLSLSDSLWQQRARKINTASIFAALCAASLNKRGLQHIVEADNSSFTPQALCKARAKLPEHTFQDMNRAIQRSRQQGPRVYAVDGSKVHVHPSYMKEGFKTRTNEKPVSRPAIRPLAMLSSMLDVHTRTCFDAVVSAHFNERKSALQHMDAAKAGDTLIFDRGYYSSQLLDRAQQLNLRVVFRLKRDAFRGVTQFFNSSHTTANTIVPTKSGGHLRARLTKYFIDGKVYVCLTNFEATTAEVKRLYGLRWRVETSFRRLKSDLNLETAHSMTSKAYVQEVQARILYDTVAVLSQDREKEGKRSCVKTYLRALDEYLNIIYLIKVCREQRLPRGSFMRLLNRLQSDSLACLG